LSYPANWYRPSLDDCPCVPNSRWLLGDLALPSCGKLALDLIKAAQDQGEAVCSSPRSGSSIISWANALPSTARSLAYTVLSSSQTCSRSDSCLVLSALWPRTRTLSWNGLYFFERLTTTAASLIASFLITSSSVISSNLAAKSLGTWASRIF